MGGLVEFGAQNNKIILKIIIVKVFSIIIGLQRTQKKELGTAHHNNAFNNRNATPINLKGNVFVNTCKHTYLS